MTSDRRIAPNMTCEYGSCQKPATSLVYSRVDGSVMVCCEGHTDTVGDEGHPEYNHTCENCGCYLPIN